MPQVEQTGRSAMLKEKSFTRSSSKSSGAHGKAVVARPSVFGWCRDAEGNERGDGQRTN